MNFHASWPALALGLCACLGPNPRLEMGDTSESQASETSVGGDGDGDGDSSAGDGDGDGDGETTDPGSSCDNGVLDGDETDLDCGGSCSPCTEGLACVEAGDCESGVCDEQACAAPTCADEVQNGDETGIDCGGPCSFCELSVPLVELDDYEGSSATYPHVEAFDDGRFALSYRGPMEARARWFDALGEPLGPAVEIDDMVSPETLYEPIYFAVDGAAAASQEIHALVAGTDAMSESTDLFLARRDPRDELHRARVNLTNLIVAGGDLLVDGERATVAWNNAGEILLRRYDYDLGQGNWSDIDPFEAETADGPIARNPYLARNPAGGVVVIWDQCTIQGPPCDVVARRFDAGQWLDPAPVVLSQGVTSAYAFPHIALDASGRAMASWYVLDIGSSDLQARFVDEDFAPQDSVWTVQSDLPAADHVGLSALSDNSFALTWADPPQSAIHLVRYVGPDTAKNPDLVDESPWTDLDEPRSVSSAALEDRLIVVWSAEVDMVDQVQGQVLGY